MTGKLFMIRKNLEIFLRDFWQKKLCFNKFTLLSKDFSGTQPLSSCTLSLSSLNHHLLQHHPSFHWNFQHYSDPNKMKFKQYASS